MNNDPLYLQALMHGELPFNKKNSEKLSKTQFEIDLEREIDAAVDKLDLNGDPNLNALQDPKLKRQSIKFNIKEEAKMPELSQHLNTAMEILFSEGQRYLSKEENEDLIIDLALSTERMGNAGIKETSETDLATLAKISDKSMGNIEKIALAKFDEERFSECLGLFCLLSLLRPGYPEYWLRMGIAAQKCKNMELASKAFTATLQLDPDNLGARLFAAECFFNQKLLEEAKAEIAAAKEIIKKGDANPVWLDYLSNLEVLIEVKTKDKGP